MPIRLKIVRASVILLGLAPFHVSCSSSHLRDLNYGTDAGVGFVPPDAATTLRDVAQDVREAAVEPVASVDGGAAFDASIDADD
jgi:hypothetical protein